MLDAIPNWLMGIFVLVFFAGCAGLLVWFTFRLIRGLLRWLAKATAADATVDGTRAEGQASSSLAGCVSLLKIIGLVCLLLLLAFFTYYFAFAGLRYQLYRFLH
ncbi:MAG: hypothetical protein AAGF31_01820 [Planctomycetota bacterium]